jgi:quinol monooxygenase YgiN
VLIVTGTIQARPETIDQIITLGVQHVRRSRLEAGCLLHSIHRDVEDPLRVVFVEQWEDEDALRAHFAVPESGQFVRSVSALAAGAAEISVFAAQPVRL